MPDVCIRCMHVAVPTLRYSTACMYIISYVIYCVVVLDWIVLLQFPQMVCIAPLLLTMHVQHHNYFYAMRHVFNVRHCSYCLRMLILC